jgi:hypothetical protein
MEIKQALEIVIRILNNHISEEMSKWYKAAGDTGKQQALRGEIDDLMEAQEAMYRMLNE